VQLGAFTTNLRYYILGLLIIIFGCFSTALSGQCAGGEVELTFGLYVSASCGPTTAPQVRYKGDVAPGGWTPLGLNWQMSDGCNTLYTASVCVPATNNIVFYQYISAWPAWQTEEEELLTNYLASGCTGASWPNCCECPSFPLVRTPGDNSYVDRFLDLAGGNFSDTSMWGQITGTESCDLPLVPSFDAIGPLCETDAPVSLPSMSNNGVDGTWNSGSNFDPSGQGGNTVTLTFTPSDACGNSAQMMVVVTDPTLPTFDAIDPLCETAAPISLPSTSNNSVNGSWSSGATFDPAGLGGSSYMITFTPSGGSCTSEAQLEITVENEVSPSFDAVSPVCENEAPFTLPSSSTNGINGTWDVGSQFDPAGQGGSTAVLNFTPEVAACASTQVLDVPVTDALIPSFTQVPNQCENGGPVSLPGVSNNGVNGTWDVGTEFDPSGQGGTTVTINFSPDVGECADDFSMMIPVANAVLPLFDDFATMCESDLAITLPSTSNNGIAGTWDVGANFDPSGFGNQTVDLEFTPSLGECAITAMKTIVVTQEIIPSFNGIGPICESSAGISLQNLSNNGISGNWDVGTSFDPSGEGGNTVRINFTPTTSCATTAFMDIVVEEELTPSFNAIGPLCEGAGPVSLQAISNNGIAGSWDVGTTFDPTGLGGTTASIEFTPNNGSCASPRTLSIVVEDASDPDFDTFSDLCASFNPSGKGGQSFSLTFVPNGGLCANSSMSMITVLNAVSPIFDDIADYCENDVDIDLPSISNNGISGTWTSGSTFDPSGFGGQTVELDFEPGNGFCAIDGDIEIEVLDYVVPVFDDFQDICASGTAITLPSQSNNGVTGTWNTGASFDPAGLGGTTVELTFLPQASLCASEAMKDILVLDVVEPLFSALGPYCSEDDEVVLPSTSNNGIAGTWNVVQFDPGTATMGQNMVTFTPDGSECATSKSIDIEVDLAEIPVFDELGVFCQDDAPIVLSATSNNGIDGTWDVGNSIDPADFVGTNNLFFTPSHDECALQGELGLEVEATPTLEIQSKSCDVSLTFYTILFSTDADIVSSDIGDLSDLGGSMYEITNLPTGATVEVSIEKSLSSCIDVISVSPRDCNCPSLAAPAGNSIEICEGETIPELVVSVEEGLEVNWYDASSGGNLLQTNSPSYIPSTGGTYYAESLDPENACTSNVRTSLELIINEESETQLTESTCDPEAVGIETLMLENRFGCDSVVMIERVFSESDTTLVFLKSCQPDDVGTRTETFSTSLCDSIVITETSLAPSYEFSFVQETCIASLEGIDTSRFTTVDGCDSIEIVEYIYLPLDTTFVEQSSCNPDLEGQKIDVFDANSCDSVVVTTTFFSDMDVRFSEVITCDPDLLEPDTLFFTNSLGCDSLEITNYVFEAIDTTFVEAVSCDPDEVGTEILYLSSGSCDSIVSVTTTFATFSESFLQESTCDPAESGVDTTFLQNSAGCDSLVIVETTLGTLPNVEFPVGGTLTCEVNNLSLDVNDLGNQASLSFQWTDESGSIVGNSSSLLATQGGTFTVSVEMQDACSITESFVVLEDLIAPEVFAGDDQIIECEDGSVTLVGSQVSSEELTYYWQSESGDLVEEGRTTEIGSAGIYEFVGVNPDNGCEGVDEVEVFPSLEIITVADEISVEQDEEIDYDIFSNDDVVDEVMVNVVNSDLEGLLLIQDDGQLAGRVSEPGDYTLEYEVCKLACPDECSTSLISIEVTKKNTEFTDAISPNGDGINEFWEVPDIEQFEDRKLVIVNRWGSKVYIDDSYSNNWQGQNLRGNPLPEGIYYYELILGGKLHTGSITILR